MTAKPTSPAPILPASTVLLLRDDPAGLLVFMVERHQAIDFATAEVVSERGPSDDRPPQRSAVAFPCLLHCRFLRRS